MAVPEETARGVDALIAQLRDDGVAAGKAEGDRLISEAKAEADRLRAAAKADADKTLAEAMTQTDRYRQAGEEALNTAMRDAVLTMKAQLLTRFEVDVQRMVSRALADPEMVKQMVLELVGRARDATGDKEGAEVILPAEVVGADAIRANADDIQSGKLTKFVLGLSQEMLADGVTLHAADTHQGGIKVRLGQDEVTLDLTDAAVADLLMQHLQPRFRAVLEGVIR